MRPNYIGRTHANTEQNNCVIADTPDAHTVEADSRPLDHLIVDVQLNTDDIDYIINDIQDENSTLYNPPKTPMMYRRVLNRIWPYADEELWGEHPDYMRIYRPVHASAMPNYIGLRIRIPSGLNISA